MCFTDVCCYVNAFVIATTAIICAGDPNRRNSQYTRYDALVMSAIGLTLLLDTSLQKLM